LSPGEAGGRRQEQEAGAGGRSRRQEQEAGADGRLLSFVVVYSFIFSA
jgi:hypothetical protein